MATNSSFPLNPIEKSPFSKDFFLPDLNFLTISLFDDMMAIPLPILPALGMLMRDKPALFKSSTMP